MNSNRWIDLPVIEAIDYFQGVLSYFMNFAIKYGNFFALIGLVWTGIRLVNSRIDIRSAWWGALSKWFIFLLLLNCYSGATALIAKIANEVGINAGAGKNTIIANFTELKASIESQINKRQQWLDGLIDLANSDLSIELEYMDANEMSDGDYDDLKDQIKTTIKSTFNAKDQRKEVQKKFNDYWESMPETESIWGRQTLEALNSVLVVSSPDGSTKLNLTGAYVTAKPELNIWLLDSDGNATSYFSSAAILRIAVLAAQIIWEKASMTVTQVTNSDGTTEYKVKKDGFSIKRIDRYIMAGICLICIIVSCCFFIIQYIMCILEFTIVQGIGAAFIAFVLFDGTQDIPKKLVPVFTGFVLKIIVMVICLMFVMNLYLRFAAEQISPESGNMGGPAFAYCIFICLLSFMLTSNAPKIAMTMLTGQPQLSMGEFVQAAAAMGGMAMAAKNAAATAASPARAFAENKMNNWSEQRAAGRSAAEKTENEMKTSFAQENGFDMSTKRGRKDMESAWKDYRNSEGVKEKIDGKINEARQSARDDMKQKQKTDYIRHGGALGTAGRMISHYVGAAANPKQTLLQGRRYQSPRSNFDVDMVGRENALHDETPPPPPATPPVNPPDNPPANPPDDPPDDSNVPEDPGVGTRAVT